MSSGRLGSPLTWADLGMKIAYFVDIHDRFEVVPRAIARSARSIS